MMSDRTKLVNGERVPLTPEEIAEIEAREAGFNSLAAVKARAVADMAAKRYEVEVGGIELNGMPVATDRDTQAKLIAVRILAKEDAAYTVRWKGPAGFVTMDAPTIIAVADAVSAHVQAAFDREAEVAALIDAATTADDLRAVEW